MVHSASGALPARRKRTRDITDCMEIQEAVGTGTYGVVYKAVDKTLPEKPFVALKKIKMEKETQGFPVTAIREIKILNLMNHKNVVHLHEIVTYENTGNEQDASYRDKGIGVGDVFMVFEYVDYDLSVILKSDRFRPTPEVIKSFMHQLLEGVDYLHKNHILHRDLKTANILITKNNILKIADWGLARTMPQSGHGHKLTVPVVTLWYRSPELTCGNKAYGPEVDIWSVGCIFAELVKRKAMFPGSTEAELLELVFRLTGSPQGALLDMYKSYPDWEKLNFTNSYQSRLRKEFDRLGELGLGLLEGLLNLNPNSRLTASQALGLDYFLKVPVPLPDSLPEIWLNGKIADNGPKDLRDQYRLYQQQQQQQPSQSQSSAAAAPPAVPVPAKSSFVSGRSKQDRERDRQKNPKLMMFSAKK